MCQLMVLTKQSLGFWENKTRPRDISVKTKVTVERFTRKYQKEQLKVKSSKTFS